MPPKKANINTSKWPPSFQRLYRLFVQINTHLTFLSSHSRTTIPTFELLQKLNPDINTLDLTLIKGLLPDKHVAYKYVDENQLMLSMAEKVEYSRSHGYKQGNASSMDDAFEQVANNHGLSSSNQLLVFDFQDTRMHGIGGVVKGGRAKRRKVEQNDTNNDFFLSSADLAFSPLTQIQLTRMINSRSDNFKEILKAYLDGFSEEEVSQDIPMQKLVAKYEPLIPQPPVLNDPVEQLEHSHKIVDRKSKPTLDEMLIVLKQEPFYKGQIEQVCTLTPAQKAMKVPLGDFEGHIYNIHPELRDALYNYKGIDIYKDLYSHQADALKTLLQPNSFGRHVIVSTATASGKSLIYQIPVLNEILWDITNGKKTRSTTAFFIFPTKALAQDQKRHLEEFISYLPTNEKRKIIVQTYDGDTASRDRNFVRSFADIVFTNPDTIHASVLPNHLGYSDSSGWIPFLRSLKFIVVDELHVYKGTFGIQVSYVMTRLLRITEKLKNGVNDITFVSCSATISNPVAHFRAVCAIPKCDQVVHVANDGSPCSERKLVVWNPPALMNKKGQIQSTLKSSMTIESTVSNTLIPRVGIVAESARLLVHLLSNLSEIKVIVFCPIRVVCELLMNEVRHLLRSSDHTERALLNEHDIMSYRGGYSKEDRRVIEQKMFTGQLRAIVATNALELGIDLSDLDIVITCGFPISKSHMHQQFGRAGRARDSKGSLAIFVAGPTPIDQYYLSNYKDILDKNSYEDLCVDGLLDLGSYHLTLEQHMQCAAFEDPLDIVEDLKWFAPDGSTGKANAFVKICQERLLKDNTGKYRTSPNFLPWPSDLVTIRAIEETSFAVVDITNGRNIVIEEVESSRTNFTLYEGGIFLHQGFPYLVREFNADQKFAKVERVNVDWTTSQRDFTDMDPMEAQYVKQLYPPNSAVPSDIPVFLGLVKTTIKVFGFFKLNRRNEILEAVDVKNSPVIIINKGFWVDIGSEVIDIINKKQLSPAAGIHAASHAIINILPVFINGTVDTSSKSYYSGVGEAELVTECKAPEKEFARRESNRKRPARLIFNDSKGGELGSGMSAKAFEYFDEILQTTFDKVRNCECEWGCPLCIAPKFCKERSIVMSKPAALLILASLLGYDLNEFQEQVQDGPEQNMPAITIETIESGPSTVKFSKDVEIISVRKARHPLNPKVEVKEESAVNKEGENTNNHGSPDDSPPTSSTVEIKQECDN
ncbi:hypothetical protein G9P44_004832 [Scheffersomyces stipitis]|nr:hypothetical protein G9P44_004832 [Scheffersomyces stipitis]